MKKILSLMFIIGILMVGCAAEKMDFAVEEVPNYKDGVSYPIVLSVNEAGDFVQGMDIVATLEMARMDHGVIEVVFSDRGDGTYEGEVELPMAGEWIANIIAERDGKSYDEMITFDVKEG